LLVPLALLALSGVLPAPVAAAADAPNSLGLSATYDVSADIRWSANELSVTSTATVTTRPTASRGADLQLHPGAHWAHVAAGGARVGEEGAAQVDDANLIVALPVALDPGAQTTVTIRYDATLNTRTKKKKWLFSEKNDVVTAYRWIPW
jgi:hypothetical protein